METSRPWSFKVQGEFFGRGGRERKGVAMGMEEDVWALIYISSELEKVEIYGSEGEGRRVAVGFFSYRFLSVCDRA